MWLKNAQIYDSRSHRFRRGDIEIARKRIAGLGVTRIVHLHQDRAIPLHDEGVGGIVLHSVSVPVDVSRARKEKCSGCGDGVPGPGDGLGLTCPG